MNDKVFDTINDKWFMLSLDEFKDWLKTHRETDMVAKVVHDNLDSLEKREVELYDDYALSWLTRTT